MAVLLILLGSLLLAALLLGAGMFLFIFYRRRVPDYTAPGAIAASRWRDYEAPMTQGAAWVAAQKPTRVTIQSFDGLTLAGQWIPRENARGTLVLLHGYRSSPVIDLYAGLSHYYALGFSLLICDQRAHGASAGHLITMGVRERYDAKAWAEYVAKTQGRDTPVYLAGISMGATTVLLASALHMEANLRGVIADCGFTSPGDIVRRLMRRHYHLPPRPFSALLNLACHVLGGFGLDQCSTVEAVAKARCPILFFHGLDDHFVPPEMTEAAYRACRSDKTLLEFPGAGHGLSFLVDEPRYLGALADFFEKTL